MISKLKMITSNMINHRFLLFGMIALTVLIGCQPAQQGQDADGAVPMVDRNELMSDITYLASDQLEGRRTDTEGNARARDFILKRYARVGLEPVNGTYEHPFEHVNPRTEERFEGAVNLLGVIPGTGVDMGVKTAVAVVVMAMVVVTAMVAAMVAAIWITTASMATTDISP